MVDAAREGPRHSATTSPPCFSFSCRPASRAYASGSLISYARSSSAIQRPEEAILNCESRAGTCLTATRIFIKLFDRHPVGQTIAFCGLSCLAACLFGVTPENQAAVGAAKAETVRQRIVDLQGARLVGNVIQIAVRIRTIVIDRCRRHLIADGKYRDRKSTRLNSSHLGISYAVLCLKKKTRSREVSRHPLLPSPSSRRKGSWSMR